MYKSNERLGVWEIYVRDSTCQESWRIQSELAGISIFLLEFLSLCYTTCCDPHIY